MPMPMRSSDSSMSRACCLVSATFLKAPWVPPRGTRLAEQIVYPIRPPDWQIGWIERYELAETAVKPEPFSAWSAGRSRWLAEEPRGLTKAGSGREADRVGTGVLCPIGKKASGFDNSGPGVR